MKKLFAVLVVLAMVAGLAACGAQSAAEAQPFKAGVWIASVDGEKTGTYTFTESKTECLYEGELSGVPFDYEINGDSYIFHMGSADDNSAAKAVFTDENSCVLTWEDPAREETLEYVGTAEEYEEAVTYPLPLLVINSEAFEVSAADVFDTAGVTGFTCDAPMTYKFEAKGDADWKVYLLDEVFSDGERYLSQAYPPALIGDGVLSVKAGQFMYVECSENAFTADAAPDASLIITYSGDLTGNYDDSYSQRATATVVDNNEEVEITVNWSSSATEETVWTLTAAKDGAKLSYTDCKKVTLAFDEDGSDTEEVIYENGAGYFTVVDGNLVWDGAAEEDCANCVFERN